MWAMYHIKYRSLALMVQPEHTSMPLQKLKILKAPRPFTENTGLSGQVFWTVFDGGYFKGRRVITHEMEVMLLQSATILF